MHRDLLHGNARLMVLQTAADHRRRLRLLSLVCALLLLLMGWSAAAASAPQPLEQAEPGAVTVNRADSSLGAILVDANGMSLYMFDKDTPGVSNCYEGCAKRWPPLLIGAGMQPAAGEGVTAELGVTERTDGTYQVTANGWPLYYWYEDVNPGDVLGQAVGDVWWVMAPDGTIIRGAAEATAEATMEPTMEATAEATMEATMEATAEATMAAAVSASGPSVAWSDNAAMGRILVAANGMTLYMFDKDTPGVSNCYDACAEKWPPLLVDAGVTPAGADGITAKLGVTERTDGTYQVTANDLPLYFWYEDVNPGDVNGQAVGDVWWVLGPDGTPMKTAAPAEATMEAMPAATAEAMTEAMPAATAEAMTEAMAEAAPMQMPVTGGDGGLLGALIAGLGVLAGGGWVALRSRKR